MDTRNDSDIAVFADAAQWEYWLADHHQETAGAWLKIAKKGSGKTTVTLVEALDVALCYGWIDSHRKACDQDYYLQRYSPRRPTSSWSQVNVDKVEALIAAGRMRDPGLTASVPPKPMVDGTRRTNRSATLSFRTISRPHSRTTNRHERASTSSRRPISTPCTSRS